MALSVGALVTNHNTWALATECCGALLRHSRRDLARILIIDDASSQRPGPTPAGVDLHISQEHLGYVRSVNLGLNLLSADLVIILDSDALPLTDLASLATRAFADDPRLGILGLGLEGGGGSEPAPEAIDLLLGQRLHSLLSPLIAHRPRQLVVHSCAMVVNRNAIRAVGGLDADFDFLDADIDLSMRVAAAGWTVRADPEPAVLHRGGGSPQHLSTRIVRYHRNRWRLLEKHGRLPGALLRPAFIVSLAARHLGELAVLRLARTLPAINPRAWDEKIEARRQLLRGVWRGYRSVTESGTEAA